MSHILLAAPNGLHANATLEIAPELVDECARYVAWVSAGSAFRLANSDVPFAIQRRNVGKCYANYEIGEASEDNGGRCH
jgi:hypothetical protein